MTKEEQPATQAQPDSPLSIVSMVLGIVSMTGPGLLLGIPAIVTAAIALKRKLGGRTLSIIGLVTGIISTVVSLLCIMLFIILIIWSATQPANDQPSHHHYSDSSEQQFDNPQT
jgi:O-antigen/teichoic acid export membrane protein